ncbi:MAG: DNA cytosine methyltransferase [Clostridiales Family XIII bacterium]|jgi:DNA (cytosine-5)-methyltransferase 1|nr:DNA cytosine methyltransferase [Clostridiales Family XIII bacterium]
MSNTQQRPKAIDLFCGAGGLSLGIEQAGFDVISAVEVDPVHAAVHSYNFPKCNTICGDITELHGLELSRGHEIDLIVGGPPCQGFSLIGKRDINDPRNDLVAQFMRLIKEIRPKYFIMENVSGLTVGDAKSLLEKVISDIETSGYHVVQPYKVLNANDYGVPQSRKRLFLLGYRDDQNAPVYPAKVPGSVTVMDAIGDLPNIDDFDVLNEHDSVVFDLSPVSAYAKKLHGVLVDETDYSYPRKWSRNVLTGSMRTQHTDKSIERFASTELGKVEPISRFLKLDPLGQCNTLRAGTDKSRGAYTSPRPIHPRDNRCISVREAERLHSFPDWFRMHSTKWHGFREVGNSVPPLLARAVASQVLSALGYVPEKPSEVVCLGDERLLYFNTTTATEHIKAALRYEQVW